MPSHLQDLRRLVKKAVEGGARRLSYTTWEWDIAGRCESPVTREHFARKDRLTTRENEWLPGDDTPLRLILHVRCRVCRDCRRLKRREWVLRASAELAAAERSWFGTLTLNPEAAFRCELLARKRLLRGGTRFEALEAPARYEELCQEVGREVTLYLKRLRKQSRARIRYMACYEAHRSGLPHLHMLVHESGGTPVRKAQLDSEWALGFSHWRLVAQEQSGRAAMYVAKYLAKDGGRVRASILYGRPKHALERNSQAVGFGIRKKSRPHLRFGIGDQVATITETAEW